MNNYLLLTTLVSLLFTVGCATTSKTVKLSDNKYMISKQAGSGFSGLGTIKSDVILKAEQFCSEKNKSYNVLTTEDSKPPYVFGNFPRTEVVFECI